MLKTNLPKTINNYTRNTSKGILIVNGVVSGVSTREAISKDCSTSLDAGAGQGDCSTGSFVRFLQTKDRGLDVVSKCRGIAVNVVSHLYSLFRGEMPSAIEIETINRCNNDCAFCPVNRHEDPRQLTKMSDALLEKIACELHKRKYNGLLALFSNNEPLMDKRIVDICRFFRDKVPGAYIYISTNGILLTPDIYTRLFDTGLDQMIINNYDDSFKLIPSIETLENFMNSASGSEIERYIRKTKIVMRKKNEVLTNRAGYAPNKDKNCDKSFRRYAKSACTLPFIQFVVRPSGQVSLCCQDALGKVTLGDVNNQSIHDIWSAEVFNDIRARIKKHGRKSVPLCNTCDVTILYKAVAQKRFCNFIGFGMSRFEL